MSIIHAIFLWLSVIFSLVGGLWLRSISFSVSHCCSVLNPGSPTFSASTTVPHDALTPAVCAAIVAQHCLNPSCTCSSLHMYFPSSTSFSFTSWPISPPVRVSNMLNSLFHRVQLDCSSSNYTLSFTYPRPFALAPVWTARPIIFLRSSLACAIVFILSSCTKMKYILLKDGILQANWTILSYKESRPIPSKVGEHAPLLCSSLALILLRSHIY